MQRAVEEAEPGGDEDTVEVAATLHIPGRASREVLVEMPRSAAERCGAGEVSDAD